MAEWAHALAGGWSARGAASGAAALPGTAGAGKDVVRIGITQINPELSNKNGR